MTERVAVVVQPELKPVPKIGSAPGGIVRALVELTKPRITAEVLMISAFGFFLGLEGKFETTTFVHTLLATALLSSGISTLNQFLERDSDRLMRRTSGRPLPAGKLPAWTAFLFGVLLLVAAEVYYVVAINHLTAWLGLFTAASYVGLYTPLKRKTTLSTFIGSFPGAMPPLVGWAAAAGHIPLEAWVLFAIMFLWQYPHFLAIAWMYREDYSRADIKMLPVVEPDGRKTKFQILLTTFILLPLSFAPAMLGVAGTLYILAAVVLGAYFLRSVLTLYKTSSGQDARRVMKASIVYITMLFLVMVLDKS
ncbi:MAG: heme o synthase [Blastocatellia bacterium]|nr:heme o synthase [Blastocatellia bacterium]